MIKATKVTKKMTPESLMMNMNGKKAVKVSKKGKKVTKSKKIVLKGKNKA